MSERAAFVAIELVAMLPDVVKAALTASTPTPQTAKCIAGLAGLKSGAYASANALNAGFHDRIWGGNQYLYSLNELGLAVREYLHGTKP